MNFKDRLKEVKRVKPYPLVQEYETWILVPAIRREISRIMTQEFDLTYENTGKILGITKAAVCQYLKHKRGHNYKFSIKELETIKKVSFRLTFCKKNLQEEFNHLLCLLNKIY
jgi:predicted transcriptional regulator